MCNVFNFYYDECGHTRVITEKAINDDQFFIYFVSTIVGWKQRFEKQFIKKYTKFEEKYKTFYCVNELKSNVVKTKKYLYGLSSMSDFDIDFLNEYCDLILDNNIFIYFSFINKVHLLISKGFCSIKNKQLKIRELAYSVSKLLVVYRPQNVIHALYEENLDKFKIEFAEFLRQLYKQNKDIKEKESENSAIEVMLYFMDELKLPANYDFIYFMIFDGFSKFLDEFNINYLALTLDKEGSGETLSSAKRFFSKCIEVDSKDSVGVRCADLCAGIFGRLLNSVVNTFHPKNEKVVPLKRLLPENWFNIDEKRFYLYKKLKNILIDKDNAWDKIYSSLYSDDLLCLITFLTYIDAYKTFDDFKKIKIIRHQESLNTLVIQSLANRFDMLGFNE